MNKLLWFLQVAVGIYFILIGAMHSVIPSGLPATMSWMYELPQSLHYVSGAAEILGGLGLIFPGLLRTHVGLIPRRKSACVPRGSISTDPDPGSHQQMQEAASVPSGAATIGTRT